MSVTRAPAAEAMYGNGAALQTSLKSLAELSTRAKPSSVACFVVSDGKVVFKVKNRSIRAFTGGSDDREDIDWDTIFP